MNLVDLKCSPEQINLSLIRMTTSIQICHALFPFFMIASHTKISITLQRMKNKKKDDITIA
jgi:hypothetical protein